MEKLLFGTIFLTMICVFPGASYAWRTGDHSGPGGGTRPYYGQFQRPYSNQFYRPWPGPSYGPYYRSFYRSWYGPNYQPWPRTLYVPAPVYVYPAPPVVYAPSPPVVIIPNQAYAYPDKPSTAKPYAPSPPPVPRQSPPQQSAPAAVLQPIYFNLSKSDIRPDAAKTLKKNLEWFKENPGKKVSIQGNCDPRATEQYNIALGKRRAEATKKYLVGLGVDAALLETTSFGKDRPICKGKDESCWAKERSVDFGPMPRTSFR